MNLFGRGLEFQNGSFAYDSKLFSLRISPVEQNFYSDFNIRDSRFHFEPERALLVEFSLHDQEVFTEVFKRKICLQELESQKVVEFYDDALRNLSDSIKHLILQDRLFKFFDVILSFNKGEEKPLFKDELGKIVQVLIEGDHKPKNDWFGKIPQSPGDTYYGSILEIQGAIFESESSLKQIRSSLKEKNLLVKELWEKFRGGVFIDHL